MTVLVQGGLALGAEVGRHQGHSLSFGANQLVFFAQVFLQVQNFPLQFDVFLVELEDPVVAGSSGQETPLEAGRVEAAAQSWRPARRPEQENKSKECNEF